MARRPLTALLAAALATSTWSTAPPPSFSISLAADASPVERFAATELADWLGNITGTRPATRTPDSATKPALAVGVGAATALGLPASALEGLGNESFVVTSNATGLPTDGRSFALSGGPGSTRGTMYAVNRLLREWGVRFIAHDETVLPSQLPDPIPPLDLKVELAYEYRDNCEWPARQAAWAGRVGYNGPSAHGSEGGYMKYASPPGFVHTSYNLLGGSKGGGRGPPADIFQQHPEWFWPRNASVYGQLCWSNASLIAYITEQAKGFLRKDPEANIISVSQNDNGNYCQTPEEMAIIDAEGTPGGALYRAVNKVADGLKDEFPHVAVDTLAYQWSRPAPKITKPRPNVIIRLCSIECNFAMPLTDPSNAPFHKGLADLGVAHERRDRVDDVLRGVLLELLDEDGHELERALDAEPPARGAAQGRDAGAHEVRLGFGLRRLDRRFQEFRDGLAAARRADRAREVAAHEQEPELADVAVGVAHRFGVAAGDGGQIHGLDLGQEGQRILLGYQDADRLLALRDKVGVAALGVHGVEERAHGALLRHLLRRLRRRRADALEDPEAVQQPRGDRAVVAEALVARGALDEGAEGRDAGLGPVARPDLGRALRRLAQAVERARGRLEHGREPAWIPNLQPDFA